MAQLTTRPSLKRFILLIKIPFKPRFTRVSRERFEPAVGECSITARTAAFSQWELFSVIFDSA